MIYNIKSAIFTAEIPLCNVKEALSDIVFLPVWHCLSGCFGQFADAGYIGFDMVSERD